MGARAQYVVVENGTWQRYYSHWAANRVADDLLPGPAAATRCFRANREIDEWLDDVWCEGAALVDHDRRVLLWFADVGSWADHLAARAVLARTWPGWDVRFAHDGLGDLTHHLGIGRDLTRSPGWFETFEPSGFPYTEYAEPSSVVSLRLPDGSVRAWGSDWEPIDHLAGGPGLLDPIVASPPTPALTDMPDGGVHFDPQTRTVSSGRCGPWLTSTTGRCRAGRTGPWTSAATTTPTRPDCFPQSSPSPAPARARTTQARRPPRHPAARQRPAARPRRGRVRPGGHDHRGEPRGTRPARTGRPHSGRTDVAAYGT